jgi:hypothetical protein
MGINALATTDSSDNTAIGYNANVTAYGARNTVIGSAANNNTQLYTANLNNTVIVINTKKLGGATVATFITNAGLTVGHKYPMKIVFNGIAPTPYYPTTSTLYVQMTVSNSDTLTMNQPAFTGQGTGNFDLYVYSSQNNSIAIGYTATTTGSNQITIGNALDSTLTINKFVADIATTPTTGQTPLYNGSKYVPGNVATTVTINSNTYTVDGSNNINLGAQGGGGGSTNANVGNGYRLAIPLTNNIKTLHAGSNITLDSGAHANEITINATAAPIDYSYHTATYGATTTIDYNTGEKFVLTLTGNTTLAFSNTVNGKTIIILLKQDATGGRTVTLPSGTIFPLGSNTGYVLNTTTTANGIDKISITYNNVTSNYEVELAKDYGH